MDKLPWETFETLDIDEAPPCHSNGFYILVNSFSFYSYFFFIVDKNQFIRTCDEHRRLFVFAFRDNLVTNDNHFSCYLQSELEGSHCIQAIEF